MKIPFNEETTLSLISQEEDSKLSWLERKLRIKNSTIISTEELSGNYKKTINEHPNQIVFKPNKWNHGILLIIAIFFFGLIIHVLFDPGVKRTGKIVVPALILFIEAGVLGVLFGKQFNFKIIISKDKLIVKDSDYQWNQIYKAYIVTRRKGKGSRRFLILALDTGAIDRYEFTNLIGFRDTEEKIAAYFEYFKKFAKETGDNYDFK